MVTCVGTEEPVLGDQLSLHWSRSAEKLGWRGMDDRLRVRTLAQCRLWRKTLNGRLWPRTAVHERPVWSSEISKAAFWQRTCRGHRLLGAHKSHSSAQKWRPKAAVQYGALRGSTGGISQLVTVSAAVPPAPTLLAAPRSTLTVHPKLPPPTAIHSIPPAPPATSDSAVPAVTRSARYVSARSDAAFHARQRIPANPWAS